MLSSNLTPEDWISTPTSASSSGASSPPSGGSTFDALLNQESGGKQFDKTGRPITSSKGAIGIAQVMPATAPEAARLAGLEFDDIKYRTDPEYNAALGRAYFEKQLKDFGDEAKALAAYNAGPGATREAIKKAEQSGNPSAWLQYLPKETQDYVPAILGKSASASTKADGEYYRPQDSSLVAYEPDNRTFFDRIAGGMEKGFHQSLALGASAAALTNRTLTGEEGNDFQKSALEFAGEHNQKAAAAGSNIAFSDVVAGDESALNWLADSIGYLGYQAAEAAITGGAGALIGKTVGKGVVANVAKNRIAAEVAKISATQAAKNMTAEQVLKQASGRVAAELAAASTLFANNIRQEAGGIYQDALNNQQGGGQAPDLTKIWLSSLAAAGVDTAADIAAAKGLMGRGASSSDNIAVRAATQVPRQMGIQGGTEFTQSLIENYGAGEDPFTKENLIQALDEGAVGALGGIIPGVGASLYQAPPELRSAMEKAKEPNSPLSKAAVAGAPAFQQQQDAAKAQEQQQSAVDPISERVRQIEDEVRSSGVLNTLRNIGQSGVTEKEFLEALAIARNPQMDQKSPLIRQRALESLEEAMQWARDGRMPGIQLSDSTDVSVQPQPPQPGTDIAPIGPRDVGPVGGGQFFDPNTVDVEATRVDNMLPGPRAIEGPRPGIGMSDRSDASTDDAIDVSPESVDAAGVQPTAAEIGSMDRQAPADQELQAASAAENSSQSRALSVDEATRGMPRVQIQPATDQEIGEAGTALRRKRKAQFRQLADDGFDDVVRTDSGFEFINTRKNKRVSLETPADAALARAAIADSWRDKSNAAATSPQNDLREPSKANIDAGNWKRGETHTIYGAKFRSENPANSTRSGVDKNGKPWQTKMVYNYGEFTEYEGADGDPVDGFVVGPGPVWVIDQVNDDGTFDEHKLVVGPATEAAAREAYLANYEPGWKGLGAIKQIPRGELRNWLKNHSKKPAAETGMGVIEVRVDGKTYTISSVPVDSLPASSGDSPSRGAKGTQITKQQAILLKGLAGFFGKDIVFFSDPQNKINSDGFVLPGDDVTIYINERSGISPLAVFGHELMHILRRDNKAAYDAIAKVVSERVKDPKGFRSNYYGKDSAEAKSDEALGDGDLEELISDLNGDLMGDGAFWRDVFDQIQADNGKEAKGIIANLAAFFQKMLDSAIAALKGQPNFRASRFISDADAVRKAFREGMAMYAQGSGISKAALQAEVLKAQQKLADIKQSAKRPDDGLTVEGYHFSKQPRQMLSTGFFGTGLQGSDREEIMSNPDMRLRQRLSFYVNKGTGIRPESGVGPIAHKAELTNIYDADADAKRLKRGRDKRAFESAVLNAGYSGYLTRLDGSQSGQVILLGGQTVKPEVLGMRTQIDDAKAVPAMAKREADLGDKLESMQIPLNGQLAPSRWSQLVMARDPELAAQLLDIGAFDGDAPLYKDELVAKVRGLQPEIKRSTKRAADEYAEVEAKYKGTDQWMRAPNGKATNLNERQWVQVRTPAFKKWFGDWEAAIAKGGVWTDDNVSKAVDENGEPLVVYHGTDKGGFMEFEKPGGTGRGDLGIFTTPDWDMARSYVRKNRAAAIEAPEAPKTKADLEALGYSFDSYMGRVSSKQTDDQELFTYVDPDGNEVDGFTSMDDAVSDAIAGAENDGIRAGDQPGVYALFLNIRNPSESDFEGATWNGERFDQYQVFDEDGEPIYDDSGSWFFDYETAAELQSRNPDSYIEKAEGHYETTDSVVGEARRYKNDGAIIRNVVDDGGGPGAYRMTPEDVFVAFSPNQLKSADFNGGEFSAESDDIRFSKKRAAEAADGDKTDVSRLAVGRAIPDSAAVGSLEKSLEMARSKSYRRGRDLKKDLQDRVLAAAKAARINLSERTKATHAFLSGMVYGDAKYALKSNENAVGWYDQKVSRAIGALSTVHPEINTDKRARLAFLWALATTSNGMKVDKNFELAEKAYSSWKKDGRMPTNIGIGNAAQAINKGMKAYNDLSGKVGEERLLKFMGTKFEVGQIERMLDVKVGGEWKGTPVRGAAILGPKIGNGFFSNLNGYFDALTMDRWLMRTWGRMTGTLLDVTKQDIDASRKKLAARAGDLTDAERRTLAKLIGHPVKKSMTKAELDAMAKASQKASMKKDKRDVMMSSEGMNDFRKAANLHHMTMDGQKEAPAGPSERNWIRAVFQDALAKLQADGLNMTMSDLQALLWYPERRLYDAAKSDEDVADGYEDDEAPDYANAAFNLAATQGVDRDKILAAMDAAEARGTVQGEQLSDEEKAEMLDEFRAAPKQPMQIIFEVAPDPNNTELTERWNTLPFKEKTELTKAVRDSLVKDLAIEFGLKGKVSLAMGSYMGAINPNMVLEFNQSNFSYDEARAFSAFLGVALDQDSVALVDGRGKESAGLVRITLSANADKHASAIMKLVNDALPGVIDFTARGKSIDILNFVEGLSTEEMANKIADAVENYDGEVDATVTFGDIKSELIGKDQYESEIRRARPEPGQDLLERARATRDRARKLIAERLGGDAVEVSGRAGVARRADAGSEAPAGRADARPVQDAGGVRGSPGRVAEQGRQDQGSGREKDGSLRGLPRDFTVAGIDIRASHWAPAEDVARKYMERAGLEYRPPAQYAKVDKQRAARIAAEYDRMKHDPKNPMVKAAYKALAKETIEQYRAVIESGLQVEFIDFAAQGDPYAASPRLMTEDVRNNNHMWVFSTRDGFGTDASFDPEDNPLLAETEFEISGQKALVNDLFSVVHDYFGHVKEGVGFRADGEENTWRAHSSMFSPLAQRALTTETRGQNSWVNYGPYGEKNRTASAGDTHFADQKTGLLPMWVSEDGRYDDVPSAQQAADEDSVVISIGDAAEAEPKTESMKDEVGAGEARGRKVSYEVTIEESGETARMTVDAGQAIQDYDDRIETMKKLLGCLTK